VTNDYPRTPNLAEVDRITKGLPKGIGCKVSEGLIRRPEKGGVNGR
jgi:hypothetical protein